MHELYVIQAKLTGLFWMLNPNPADGTFRWTKKLRLAIQFDSYEKAQEVIVPGTEEVFQVRKFSCRLTTIEETKRGQN